MYKAFYDYRNEDWRIYSPDNELIAYVVTEEVDVLLMHLNR